MSKLKDTDYLFISTRLRALENRMLTRERMERMLEARSNEDAAKVLSECGYEGLEPLTAQALERSLAQGRDSTFSELAAMSPSPQIVDIFRMKYDYHNAKVLVKSAASGQDGSRLLIDAGRYPAQSFQTAFQKEELGELSDTLQKAVVQAKETLAATGDPQRSDFVLDRAYFKELGQVAEASGSEFLQAYVRLMIDAANLKSAVRTIRMHKDLEFLNAVIMDGGNVSRNRIASAVTTGGSLESTFTGSLQNAAALGDSTSKGGSQTAFERACDNALGTFLQGSRMTPFGESVLIAYMAAKENEITAARIILSGRLSGVPTTSIRERLRDAYV